MSLYDYTAVYTRDSTDLVYLRSRYYAPAAGRFLSKDTWEGDADNPVSLNRWTYVEANPISYTDPSGNIPSPLDVNTGNAIYSCNCGWIDFGHANSGVAGGIIDLLKAGDKRFPAPANAQQDMFAISPYAQISIWGREIIGLPKETVSLTAVVRTGLSQLERNSVALGIFRNLEEKVEFTQGKANETFTYFSFEDLSSDQIGFYLALKYGTGVNPAKEGYERNDLAWRDLSHKCGFPEERHQAIIRSQRAYESQWGPRPFLMLLAMTPHIFTWDTPLLCALDGMCDNEPKRWPAEFQAVTPIQPIRNGSWWFYDANLDGKLMDYKNGKTDPQFHYLNK